MLKPEDCKPGVEVIAIKNVDTGTGKPLLSIGMIYTIIKYFDDCYDYVSKKYTGLNCIILAEIDNSPTRETCSGWAYELDQFKLRNPTELIDLFRLNDIDQELLKENELETV